MTIEIESLQSMAYFSDVDTAELESIRGLFREIQCEKGEHFLSEGDWSDSLYFIVSGLVKVYKTSPNGKQQVLHIAPPGDSLNDVSLYDGGPTAAGMVALTPVILYTLNKVDITRMLCDKPRITMNVVRSLAARIRRDSDLLEDLSSSQVLVRLSKLFLGQYGGEEITAGLNLTQQDMASLVGSSREMVNRSLRVLEEMGGIRLSRRKIIVLDKRVLHEIVQGTSDIN
ncbi:MAG: Crp/Fnr family transcriptional regulator [Dehalococcoidales bacterium]|nr:Crp/Fnr family transcriptional regulator [Dehalococcoidales bacterium]